MLEGSGCDLHSIGLRFNAETGEISGTPTAEEPMEVDCVIQAVQDESKGLIENSSVTRCKVQRQVLVAKLLLACQVSLFCPVVAANVRSSVCIIL